MNDTPPDAPIRQSDTTLPGMVVDSANRVLWHSPGAAVFVRRSGGTLPGCLTAEVAETLGAELMGALGRAFRSAEPSLTPALPVELGERVRRVALHVLPLPGTDHKARALVSFLETGSEPAFDPSVEDDATGAAPSGDRTADRRTELELRERSNQYQALFDAIEDGFFIMDVLHDAEGNPCDLRYIDVNAAFARQTGLGDVIGRTAREMVPGLESFWFKIYGRIARTRKPERFEYPAKTLQRYYEVLAFPMDRAHPNRVGALFRDVRDRKEAEMQREMLTHELSHRVKNTLAVVQALARQSHVQGLSVEEYRRNLVGRIGALAMAHDQLLSTSWRSADLESLIRTTLSGYQQSDEHRVTMTGPSVELTPKQGLGLALILHELATNASKYGGLSEEHGALSIDWAVEQTDDHRQVRLDWSETGGPSVTPPETPGFGVRLIERASSYELEGSAELCFAPGGLKVKIAFPLK